MEEQVKKDKKGKINKEILNIIRTTMRNNIELTNIADGKANVLLSVNALMLTFLLPIIIPYVDVIKQFHLTVPLVLLIITCLVVIYIAALVLKPGHFNREYVKTGQVKPVSPFFFGNFYEMTREEFHKYARSSMADSEAVKDHVLEDLHYIGVRLGRKMTRVRLAFNIFIFGFFSSIILAAVLLFIFGK